LMALRFVDIATAISMIATNPIRPVKRSIAHSRSRDG
jgi:hypothetical protein